MEGKIVWHLDSNLQTRRIICSNLERLGCIVVGFNNTDEIIDRLGAIEANQLPSAVITEVAGTTGKADFAILSMLRRNQLTQNVPILVLTECTNDQDVSDGWQLGADCILSKPFNPMEVSAVLRRFFKSLEEYPPEPV
jgi:DNA-binding response OmpR family regulator